jgi:hypothetical protein
MALSIAKSAASIAKRPHRGTCNATLHEAAGSPNRGGIRIDSPHQVIYWSPAALPAICDSVSRGTFFRRFHAPEAPFNCRKSSSSRGQSALSAKRTSPRNRIVYSAAAAHEPIFPPGAKADAMALAWVVVEGGG